MKTGGRMGNIFIFVGVLGAVALIGTVFIYSNIEKNDSKDLIEGVNKLNLSIREIVEKQSVIIAELDVLTNRVNDIQVKGFTSIDGKINQASEVLHNYIETVDKRAVRLSEEVSSLQYRARASRKPIDINIKSSVPIDIVYSKKEQRPRGAETLLQKSGVTK